MMQQKAEPNYFKLFVVVVLGVAVGMWLFCGTFGYLSDRYYEKQRVKAEAADKPVQAP
jgi:hypothetical protein